MDKWDSEKFGDRIQLVTFAKEELERRRQAVVHVVSENVDERLSKHYKAIIFAPRSGSNLKTFHFWKNRVTPEQLVSGWTRLGHRHTVEAVIYYEGGEGYSVIDGITYPWQPGDIVCVPMFAWHRHVLTQGNQMVYLAATTSPLSMYLGIAVYEDERYPECWVFAGKGEKELESLIPGAVDVPAKTGDAKSREEEGAGGASSFTDKMYSDAIAYASNEEKERRAGKVLIRAAEVKVEPTRMGRVGLAVDPRAGFHMRTLGTLLAEIPPGKRSGAHRHVYEETNYVLAGDGYSIIDDQRYDWKKGDSLCIPLFAWHQHFSTGRETAHFLVHHNRPYMENMGFLILEHGEDADF